ncbi:MAG: hypothetical protein HC911_07470 [Chloroflexaceae bacterium]|nr:hypothetical protein [Chloroflexaceae bacterium]
MRIGHDLRVREPLLDRVGERCEGGTTAAKQDRIELLSTPPPPTPPSWRRGSSNIVLRSRMNSTSSSCLACRA